MFFMAVDNLDREYISFKKDESGTITRIIPESKKALITFDPQQAVPFRFINKENGQTEAFGKLPFSEKVEDGYSVFQGQLAYHPQRKALIYTTFSFPYIALYKKENGKYNLSKEVLLTNDCKVTGGNLIFDKSKKGIGELALTKDYIVTLQRDTEADQTDERSVGRDFNKLPHTVFLYNYDLELKRIINIGMPILRLSADPTDNLVYAITINPDFTIIKFKI